MRDADREVLAFAAAHHLMIAEQVPPLLGIDADAATDRLARLQRAGLIRHMRIRANRPSCYQITTAGLAAIGSELPPPRLDPTCSRHDVGAGWLWLIATKGTSLGPVEQVLTERQMRAHDTRQTPAHLEAERPAATPDPPQPNGALFGFRPGEAHRPPSARLHYPDVLLITPDGRVPIELRLTCPSVERHTAIMRVYAAQPNIHRVLYMTDDQNAGRIAHTVSSRLGLSALIHIERVRIQAGGPA